MKLNDIDESYLSSVLSILGVVKSVSIGFELYFDEEYGCPIQESVMHLNNGEVTLRYWSIHDMIKDYTSITSTAFMPIK